MSILCPQNANLREQIIIFYPDTCVKMSRKDHNFHPCSVKRMYISVCDLALKEFICLISVTHTDAFLLQAEMADIKYLSDPN